MEATTKRLRALMLGHGSLVMILGMLSGFALTFSLLEAVEIWPFPAIPFEMPGTTRGWVAAHTGCILNGLMVIAVALALPHLHLEERPARWVAYGLIFTAWGNTMFYVFGNFATNRGLSMGGNRFGDGSLAGVLAFAPAIIAAVIVIIVLSITARAAFRVAAEAGSRH